MKNGFASHEWCCFFGVMCVRDAEGWRGTSVTCPWALI